MTTTQKTVSVLGQTLRLRGDNGVRASWNTVADGFKLYAYRCNGEHTVKISHMRDGVPDPIAAGHGDSFKEAERDLVDALHRLGVRSENGRPLEVHGAS